jgi:tetratricopeptide (TPR) repeat protein
MKPANFIASIALLIAPGLFLSSCHNAQEQAETAHLGELSFAAKGNEAAQPLFKKGLLLLHSFEYADAAEAFEEARKIDTSFVMAYWGEAMTCNHPIWQEQDYEKGNAILDALAPEPGERMAKAATEIEKDFIGGINILFGEGNKAERDSSYAAYMKQLYKKYPGNDEVAAFYSLALNGWGSTSIDASVFQEAAAVGKEVLQRNPNHPGALHYVIHAYDNPDFAKQALATADKYATVAADAGHALHMPTHTYLALGMWDKVVSSNEVSWAAEQARKQRKNLDNDALGYHAYHWLQYGYLQQGNAAKARQMLDSMQLYCTTKPSPRARAHLIYMKTTYLGETGDYQSDLANWPVEQKDMNISTRARHYFVQGMQAYRSGDSEALDYTITKLTGERLTEQERIEDKGLRVCGNINRSMPTKTDLLDAEIMELELKAMQAWMTKQAGLTEKLLKKAVELQKLNGYSYGPPAVVKPAFEMYGEWLFENNQPKEALAIFEEGLKLLPNKTILVKGGEKAKAQMQQTALLY